MKTDAHFLSSHYGNEWSHPSVIAFAKGRDPVRAILEHSSALVTRALDAGWKGPPFDPLQLADILKIKLVPNASVLDARTVISDDGESPLIEFNPNRAPTRVRFNIAHEIAHTFFSDWHKEIRHRDHHKSVGGDSWQLEMLCNLAAAELLMPEGSIEEVTAHSLNIDHVNALREKFNVSVEAVLIRLLHLVNHPFLIFAASRDESGKAGGQYKVDYSISRPAYKNLLPKGAHFKKRSVVERCRAIGFTAKGIEAFPNSRKNLEIECIAIAAYPGQSSPRVVGIAKDPDGEASTAGIVYVQGDALQPHEGREVIVCHVVNDRTANWGGGGFAAAVKRRYPKIQANFKEKAASSKETLSLGATHFDRLSENACIAHLVAQHGYGPSNAPRIRYSALRACLEVLAEEALARRADVQMPRIGVGNAGGNWLIIRDIILETVCSRGIHVTVCDLPRVSSEGRPGAQEDLF